MKNIKTAVLMIVIGFTAFACLSDDNKKQNEIVLGETTETDNGFNLMNTNKISDLTLRPSSVLLTGNKNH